MGQGFHDERRRRSQFVRLLLGVLMLGAFLALLTLAYMVGLREQALELEEQQRETQGLRLVLERERQARAEVTAARDAALNEAAALRQRIQNEVPVGVAKQMLDLARERLAAGVRPERVASALQRAENAKNCEPAAARRLTVRSPPPPPPPVAPGVRAPPPPIVPQPTTIGEQLTLLVEGQAARDANGQALPVFDPAEAVQLRLVAAGAKQPDVEGKLPLSHVLFTGAWEYRLALSAAQRGQVTLVIERCPFP
ncbi:MAG: hypothetical protein ACOVVK_18305 [Elsteraceae bacterium]